jgi:hypothetical protein
MSELTAENAARAIQLVKLKYAAMLPANFVMPDKDRFKFYTLAGGFDTVFQSIYIKTFRKANNAIFGDEKIGAAGINGFVTPDVDPRDRIIYINLDGAGNFGTLVHETLHAISHADFYPRYYCVGGQAPAVVEGITEYLTRKTSLTVGMNRSSYEDWYLTTESWVGAEGSTRHQQMANWIFRGQMPAVWPGNYL